MKYEPLILRANETVILDTDLCCDVDDAAAATLLYGEHLDHQDAFHVGGVAVSVNGPLESKGVRAIQAFFGLENVPVGVTTDPVPSSGNVSSYLPDLAKRWNGPDPEKLSALDLYRKVLANAADGSVTIISIGFFNNLAAALRDDPKLFHRKVRAVVAMAGGFGRKEGYVEFNVKNFPADSIEFLKGFHGQLVFVGSECGETIMTDLSGLEGHEGHYLVEAFRNYTGDAMQRSSWDPVTVDFTVNGENEYYALSEPGHVRATPESSVVFVPCESGNARYMIFTKADDEITRRITARVRQAARLPQVS